MSETNRTLSERDNYRIGRHFLDGADAEWIASREQIAQADAESAWEFCRERLSNFVAAGEETRLLSDAELHGRSEECIRLLLHWHEVLSANERWAIAVKGTATDTDLANEEDAD